MLPYRLLLVLAGAACCCAAERKVDPTFLRRSVSAVPPTAVGFCRMPCQYRPLFGEGDPDAGVVRSVSRYGELTLPAGGSTIPIRYEREEGIYVVLSGDGVVRVGAASAAVGRGSFLYLPPAVEHSLSNRGQEPMKAMVMHFRIPAWQSIHAPPKLEVANLQDVKKQVVGNHPPSTLYQLLIGDRGSTRDRIAAGHVVTSLFVMEMTPGGTNFPHHHEREEEIYLLMDGRGEMVAGGGMDGVEGRFPAQAGDAYFFRLNCTVGFYNADTPGSPVARILAVRSLFPFPPSRRE